jgi:hypothetical protein
MVEGVSKSFVKFEAKGWKSKYRDQTFEIRREELQVAMSRLKANCTLHSLLSHSNYMLL